MTGVSPEAQVEARRIGELIVSNPSLRRLAENPLLLTMLLVVKHGAGRLPPDRVTLYSRAVEVLLDTWNIKGHEPLNLKEAVPQLAFVAFQLMGAGKQTATEKELLALLEEAREKVPQIRRYAKDNPQEFLKRVELRSSLLVESGRQAEGTGTVPFYQFRHLTFQEYLAAVAAVEGHYVEYQKTDTVLTPLQDHLTAAEWKEVVPMSAVLARKQAEPLIGALVEKGICLRKRAEANKDFEGKADWQYPGKLPAPVVMLVQCLVEEAEAAPDTLTAALQLVAFFATGCRSKDDWQALSRGPYGADLLHQAWLLYAPMQWTPDTGVRNTCTMLAAYRHPDSYWDSSEGNAELNRLLHSPHEEEVGRGLFTCSGLLWDRREEEGRRFRLRTWPLTDVERHIFHHDPALQLAAIWGWSLIHLEQRPSIKPSPSVLNRLLRLWLSGLETGELFDAAAYALSTQLGLPRGAWTPQLSAVEVQQLRRAVDMPGGYDVDCAVCMVAFHSEKVFSDEEVVSMLVRLDGIASTRERHGISAMLKEMDKTGQKYLKIYREHDSQFRPAK